MSITLHINQRVFFADCTCVCNAFLNALLDNHLVNYSILLLLYILKGKFSIICSFIINVYF